MLKGLLKTIGKIYFGHKLVLWMILAVLPVGVSVFIISLKLWASLIAQLVKNPPAMQDTPVCFVQFLGQDDPLKNR